MKLNAWPIVAAVLLCGRPAPGVPGNRTLHSSQGWTIGADPGRACLTIRHERLGMLLEEVRLNLEGDKGPRPLAGWKTETNSSGDLVLKTSDPASAWLFECAPDSLTISSTAPDAVLTGLAPVSKTRRLARLMDAGGAPVTWRGTDEVVVSYKGGITRNPSFLPRENPECMYFALGQVAGSVFHSLFDQLTDTAIRFTEKTRFSACGQATDRLAVVMPLRGPALVRIIPDYYTKVLGVPYYVPFDDSVFSRPPAIWCSWTSYYEDVTEGEVVHNTDWLSEHLKPYGFQYVQIDDGYDRVHQEPHYWMDHWDKQKFPRGPQWIARYIKSKGLKAGLWLVPNAWQGAVETHPDWYLRDRQGQWVPDYLTPALDSTHPGALECLKTLFQTLNGYGFEYYKFDGEFSLPKYAPPVDVSRLHDPTADPLVVYRHRLEVIRSVVGTNTFIEGCPAGTPLNGIGYFNSYFNAEDLYNNWKGMCSLFTSINANAFLNRVVCYVMPGEGMELGARMSVEEAAQKRPAKFVRVARGREVPLSGFGVSLAEARTLVSLVSLSGVAYPLAGVMPELPAERLPLLQRTLPTVPIAPLDLFSRGAYTHARLKVPVDDYIHNCPELVDLKVNAKSGTYDVVALPNWRSGTITKTAAFADQLGLDPGAKYVAFDFWNQKLLGVVSNRLPVEIPSHDTRVVLLHPLMDRPQLVGTSRHITGAYSIEDLSWDAARRTLQGQSETVPGEDYTLFIHLPSGRWTHARASASSGGSPLPVRQEKHDHLLSVSFKGGPSPVAWQIKF